MFSYTIIQSSCVLKRKNPLILSPDHNHHHYFQSWKYYLHTWTAKRILFWLPESLLKTFFTFLLTDKKNTNFSQTLKHHFNPLKKNVRFFSFDEPIANQFLLGNCNECKSGKFSIRIPLQVCSVMRFNRFLYSCMLKPV